MSAKEIICEIATRHDIHLSTLLSGSRLCEVVMCRRECIAELYGAGFRSAHIARVLKLDISTVCQHVKKTWGEKCPRN